MKYLLTILFTFYFLLTTAGSTLNISISRCKTEATDTACNIQLFKNGEPYKIISLRFHSKPDTILTGVDSGIYFFKFTNIFKQIVTDSLVISKDTVYWKSLCIDDFVFDSSFRGHIDSLKNNESFSIDFESYGCFHLEIQKLKIFKKDNRYFSTLYPTNDVRKNRTEKVSAKNIMLTETQLNLISNFQADTYKYATGYPGSTELTYYIFKYRKEQLKFVDSEESRDRFKNLVTALYKKSE